MKTRIYKVDKFPGKDYHEKLTNLYRETNYNVMEVGRRVGVTSYAIKAWFKIHGVEKQQKETKERLYDKKRIGIDDRLSAQSSKRYMEHNPFYYRDLMTPIIESCGYEALWINVFVDAMHHKNMDFLLSGEAGIIMNGLGIDVRTARQRFCNMEKNVKRTYKTTEASYA